MTYNFDEPVIRHHTCSVKYDLRKEIFDNKDLIPMWVADMDFRTAPFIIDSLKRRLDHEILGYTYHGGEYYNSIIDWIGKRHNWKIEKEWILFSPGIVPALNISTLAYTNPGDSVIVQPPVYFPFFSAVEPHKRILEYNQLKEDDGQWSVDFEDLRKRASKGARILILSNPHNPVGRVWTPDELKKIGDICLENDIIIISDEIHSDLVFPGNTHTPLASLSKELAAITVTCMAPSKSFNLAGLATSSIIISNDNLREMFNKEIANLHIEKGNIFGNEASIAAYRHGAEWLDQLLAYLTKNIDYVIQRCTNSIPLIKPVRPEATYLIWLDCREMDLSPEELGKFFSLKAGVGLNEGSVFGPGGEGFMRMNLATPLAVISEAFDKIENAIKTL